MKLTSINLETDNTASSNDDFYSGLIEEERYYDFLNTYVAPLLKDKFEVDVSVTYVNSYCSPFSISTSDDYNRSESYYDDLGKLENDVRGMFNDLCMHFWDWVEGSGTTTRVTAIDWENETTGNYAADQIKSLIQFGVDQEKAISAVTNHILEDYEDYPQSGHSIEVS